jgi:large subunit ribosomal protein L35
VIPSLDEQLAANRRETQRGRHRYPPPSVMPKMKTHSGAKKRFKLTAKGKVRGRHAYSSHILEKKSPKRKRAFRKPREISPHDAPRIKKMLGVGK